MKNNNRYLKKFLTAVFIIIALTILFQGTAFAESVVKIGLTEPIVKDSEAYKGFNSFIYQYLNMSLNKVPGVQVENNNNANSLVKSEYRRIDIESITSGFISQLKLYMNFDILIVSQINKVFNKKNKKTYTIFKVRVVNPNAEEITQFKITTSDEKKMIGYMNKAIEIICKRIVEYDSKYDAINFTDDLKKELEKNEKDIDDFSMSYYYLKDMDSEELYQKEGGMLELLKRNGFSDKDISIAFLRRFSETELYSKALSYALGLSKSDNRNESIDVFVESAYEMIDAGLFNPAVDILNTAIYYKSLSDKELEQRVMHAMTKALIKAERYITAESYSIAVLDTAKKKAYMPILIDAYNYFSLVSSKLGKYKEALISIEELRKKIEEKGSKIWMAEFFLFEAKTLVEQVQFDKASKSISVAEKIYKALGNIDKLIEIHMIKAKLYQAKLEYDKGNDEIKKAMEMAIDNKKYVYIREINRLMRKHASDIGGKRAYFKSDENKYVEIYNEYINDIHNRAFIRSIVKYHLFNNQYDKAIKLMKKSLKISEKIGTQIYIYKDYVMLGDIYLNIGNDDLAFLNYADALSHVEKSKNQSEQLKCLINLADVFNIRGETEKAISTYEAVGKSAEVYGLFTLAEESYYKISLIYKDKGNDEKYKEYSRKALSMGKLTGSPMVDEYNRPLKSNY